MRKLLPVLVLALVPLLGGCPAIIATGVGTGVVVAEDRRTAPTIAEDNNIEIKASARIREKFADSVNVSTTSYNAIVLLTGTAPTQDAKREIERLVRAVERVRGINSELAVGPATPLSARANDGFITTKIKTNFIDANKFFPSHVKVVTEAGIAYLLGLVKRQEAKDAIDIARNTSGVAKVVTLFEYLD